MQNQAQARVIDPILSEFARGYQQSDMVARLLFPEVFVGVSGGKVIEFGKESFLVHDSLRTPGAATKRIEFGYTGKPFALENHALEALAPDELSREAKLVPGIDLAQESVAAVMDAAILKLEYQAARLATDAAQYGADNKTALTGTSQWSSGSSKPRATILAARAAIRAATGRYPNLMILPAGGIAKLDEHVEVRDRLKYTSAASATAEMLAQYFGVTKVVEGGAVFATNEASEMSDVWGNNVILAYVAPAGVGRSARTASFGYTYTLRGHPAVGSPYRDENRRSWVYPVQYERAPVIAGAGAGYLVQNVF